MITKETDWWCLLCLQVEKAVEEKQDWIDKHLGLVSSTALHADLPVTASQVMSEKGSFDALVIPIMNKPKPKPKVSPLYNFYPLIVF